MTQARVDLGYNTNNALTTLTRYTDVAGTTLAGTTAYGYDNADRLTAITNKNASAATLSYYDYTLNSAGLVTQESWQSENTSGGHDQRHEHLQLRRDEPVDGRRRHGRTATTPTATRHGAGDVVGANNELTNDGTWTYTYDAVGDLVEKSKGPGLETWYYGYDTLNRLTSVEQTSNGTALLMTVTYSYDVYGNRYEEQDWQSGGATTVTYTAYDNGAAWADLTSSLAVQTRYLAGPGVNQWLAQDRRPAATNGC